MAGKMRRGWVVWGVVIAAIGIGSSAPRASESDAAECGDSSARALAVVDAYIETFNARDADAHAATLAYPSFRIDRHGALAVFQEREDYARLLRTGLKQTPWHHSLYDDKTIVQVSDRKVHVAVRFSRYAEDGTKLATHDSLYIVTCRAGEWGIAARSSFVPIQGP